MFKPTWLLPLLMLAVTSCTSGRGGNDFCLCLLEFALNSIRCTYRGVLQSEKPIKKFGELIGRSCCRSQTTPSRWE